MPPAYVGGGKSPVNKVLLNIAYKYVNGIHSIIDWRIGSNNWISIKPPHRNNVVIAIKDAVGTVKTCSGIRAPIIEPNKAPIITVIIVINKKPNMSCGILSLRKQYLN